jgi:CspA family cold shock protein
MQTGTIKFYDAPKGYGYIIPATGGRDVYFHITGVHIPASVRLEGGVPVTFEIYDHPCGKRAKDVRLVTPVLPCPCCGRG